MATSGWRRTAATSCRVATFTEQENNAAAMVAILNDTLAKQMFGQSDPIGKTVSLNDQSFQVIGVYQATAGFLKTMDGRGPNRPKVIVPLESARRHLGARTLDHVDREAARSGHRA
jgi:hypothetical protein